ncbi:MAG: TonB-dependent receptor [Bacteroidetes bacterium]|nr:TonB-dependent receptor [Bacteroidota bacterium]
MTFIKKHFSFKWLLLALIVQSTVLTAQKDTLQSMIFVGTGQFRPTIADASKMNETPVVVDSTKKLPLGAYGFNSKKINTGFDVDPIAPAQMVGEPLTKLYSGLVKIGMGTYTTPYGEVWFNSLRSKEHAYGFRMKHLSSKATLKDYGFAGFSDNEISLYGKKFLKEHTLSGNFDYARNVVHFYGYDPTLFELEDDATVQRFNLFSANADLMSHYPKASRYNHDIKLSYYNLADLYKSSENNIKASGYLQTALYKELLRVNASVDYYNYKTKTDTTNNTIITLNPNFIAKGERYSAQLGVSFVMDMFVQSKFYFYQKVDLSYNIFDEIIIPFVGASGGLQKNSFKTLTDNNPFVFSELMMKNSNQKYELYGGLKGTLSSKIAYNARASYQSVGDMALFVNDREELLQNRFNVIYDDVEVLNVGGEVTYQSREKLRINLRGDYFNYKAQTELRAWYKPELVITLSANYNLRDKIVAKVDLFYLGNQFAKTFEADASSATGEKVVAKELNGVFDANIGLEYRYNKKLGFFLNVNNIASVRYMRYMNYPTQRFNLMGGLSYSF